VSVDDTFPLSGEQAGSRTLLAGKEDSITIEISKRDREHLERLATAKKIDLDVVDTSGDRLSAIVRSKDYAGIVGLPDTDSIYIRPKIEGAALLRLLQLDESGSDIETLEQVAQLEQGGEFVDLLAGMYTDELATVMRQGIERSYRRVSQTEDYVRGQLDIQTQLQQSGPASVEFHCSHDELTHDTDLNRTVLHAARVLLRLSEDQMIQRRLRRQVSELRRDVTLEPVTAGEAETIRLTRMNRYYENLLRLAKLVINNVFIDDLDRGESLGYTLLLDMPDRYQDALLGPLRDVRDELAVIPEKQLDAFLTGDFELTPKPDFVFTSRNEPVLVADAKWKDLDGSPSPPDIYQLIAYQQYLEVPGVLLYPQSKSGETVVKSASVANGYPLYAGTVPVQESGDDFAQYRSQFVDQLREIVDEAVPPLVEEPLTT